MKTLLTNLWSGYKQSRTAQSVTAVLAATALIAAVAASQGNVTTFSCEPTQRVRVDIVEPWEVDLECIDVSTPEPTATATATPTDTPTNTPVPTDTPTLPPTATSTPLPTATATIAPTATSTATPIPTVTPPPPTSTPLPPTPTPLPSGFFTWMSDFSGDVFNPAAPLPAYNMAELDDWGFVVHSRDTEGVVSTMDHDHGLDCAGPPAEHQSDQYEDALFFAFRNLTNSFSSTFKSKCCTS